jgi:hypothetical protein
VSTGIETAPGSGRKDPRQLRRFIEAARGADSVVPGEERNGNGLPPYDWEAEEA